MSNSGFNVLNKEEMKAFAIKNIDNDIEGEYTLTSIDLDEEYSNHHVQKYHGEVYFEEDGSKVSSMFNIIVYKNGTYEFEWS